MSLLTSNPSCSTTGDVEAAGMASGLVVATRSTWSTSNTRAFDWPQESDTTAPSDIDHHKLALLPNSKL